MISTFLDWIRSLNWSDENVRGAGYAALVTLALIVALKLVARFIRKLRDRYNDEQGAGLRLQKWEMVSADRFRRSVRYFLGFLHALVAILLIDIYVTLVLRFFPATEALSDRYFELITLRSWRSLEPSSPTFPTCSTSRWSRL